MRVNLTGVWIIKVKYFTVRSRIKREKRNGWFNSELRVLRWDKIIK